MIRLRLADERGVTLVELLVVCATLGIVLTGIVNVFISSTRASSDANGRFQAQQSARLALDRLQFEARCASAATAFPDGTGVTLTLPASCSHATGSVTWCLSSGTLMRYPGSTCSGSGIPFVSSVTSASFAVATSTGDLPRLQMTIATNETGRASDAFSLRDAIALRNAAPGS